MKFIGLSGRAVATTAFMIGASVALPTAASAADVTPKSCGAGSFWIVDKVGGRYYKTSGDPAGKYNASPSSSTLKYAIKITKSRSSGWSAGGGLSVKAAVVTINGSGNYHVTKTNTTGVTVTDTLKVPGKHYGYVTPKVEFQKFHIQKGHYGPHCSTKIDKDYGVFGGITAALFWSECVGKNPCTPKP
ncbi:hypothetical protein ACF073_24310 [Streptomyces sp. NPDC015171]|uniref:hypothetical protein n=1 Tax=Streptomyces sp. NPDC015171 TaxID=3364945 RepID=UPI0036FEE632